VSPEAWAGGPLGGVRDGDRIRLVVDTRRLEGSVDAPDLSAEALRARGRHPGLRPDPRVPADTRLWSALQQACGGTWAGCVHDADRIARLLELGLAAERAQGDRPAG
jgi:dihydroxyacid dehydratase/phosphogluconate dehydratase